ncbi:MAG: tetratricopeptide repeat protein, partial [Candidatus Omnitrophica bacterium]|nr:tetratricopeptide repeat protein [Candidatus Omnitrophota bacterium]
AAKKAIELDPGSAEAHYTLGVACFNKGLSDEARSSYERSRELGYDPDQAFADALTEYAKTEE